MCRSRPVQETGFAVGNVPVAAAVVAAWCVGQWSVRIVPPGTDCYTVLLVSAAGFVSLVAVVGLAG